MICYKDQTFCDSDCKNMECFRYFDEGVSADALKFGLPIAIADFSTRCDFYISPRQQETE